MLQDDAVGDNRLVLIASMMQRGEASTSANLHVQSVCNFLSVHTPGSEHTTDEHAMPLSARGAHVVSRWHTLDTGQGDFQSCKAADSTDEWFNEEKRALRAYFVSISGGRQVWSNGKASYRLAESPPHDMRDANCTANEERISHMAKQTVEARGQRGLLDAVQVLTLRYAWSGRNRFRAPADGSCNAHVRKGHNQKQVAD